MFFMTKKVTRVGFLPVHLAGVYVYMFFFIWQHKRRRKSWTLPLSLSLSLYLSPAPLSYLTERDDRRSGVSVNRAKRWRDGKMDSI